jgi:hypothetical protein
VEEVEVGTVELEDDDEDEVDPPQLPVMVLVARAAQDE